MVAAQPRRYAGNQQSAHQGRQGAEARNQQRAGQRRDGEQNERKAGENADLGPGQVELGLDQRDDRRHRQDGQPQSHAAEPEQAGRGPKFSHGRSRMRLSPFCLVAVMARVSL